MLPTMSTKLLQLAGGITYDVYRAGIVDRRRNRPSILVGRQVQDRQQHGLSGRIQDDVNARYSRNVSGRATFDYDF